MLEEGRVGVGERGELHGGGELGVLRKRRVVWDGEVLGERVDRGLEARR